MAVTDEMFDIALRIKPHSVTLVPEGRQELTTESGLRQFDQRLHAAIADLHQHDILPVLFIDPDVEAVRAAKQSGCATHERFTYQSRLPSVLTNIMTSKAR